MKQLSPCGRTGHGLVWLLVSAFPLTLAAAVHLIDPGAVPIPSIGRNSHLVLDASGHPVVVFSDQITMIFSCFAATTPRAVAATTLPESWLPMPMGIFRGSSLMLRTIPS